MIMNLMNVTALHCCKQYICQMHSIDHKRFKKIFTNVLIDRFYVAWRNRLEELGILMKKLITYSFTL